MNPSTKKEQRVGTITRESVDRWRWLRYGLLPLILLAMIPLLEAGVEDNSPTSDEWNHFTRGVSFWTTGDTKLSYAHPPLANAIAGFPVVFEDDVPDLRKFEHWEDGMVSGVHREYTKVDYARARAQLVTARRMMFIFPLLLVTYVYFFCLSQYGFKTAAAAALLLAFNPNVLAHGSLVTTDLPAAFGYVIATGEFARYLRGPASIWRVITLSLAVGVAVLLKHSCILLIPALGLIGLIAAIRGWGVFGQLDRLCRAQRYLGHITATTLIAVLVVNTGYRFNDTGMRVDEILAKSEPQYWISKPYKQKMLEQMTPLEHLPDGLRIPLPYTQIFGITCIRGQNKRGWFRSYFWGRKQPIEGHPLYFPVLLLIKTPLLVFGLLIAGLVTRRPWHARPSTATATVAVMLAYFIVMIVRSNLNMGMRHMMPAIPLLTILAARGFEETWARIEAAGPRTGTYGRAVLFAAVVSAPGTAVLACPDYLGWFNAGVGRERGHWISIVGEDWNQDLARAGRFAKANGLTPLYITEYTPVSTRELQWAGVVYRPLPCKSPPRPGSYVLSRAAMMKTRREKCYRWVIGRTPTYHINHHMFIYHIAEEEDLRAPRSSARTKQR